MQDADRAVRESSLDWTIVRPSNFAQSFDEDVFAALLLRGELALPAGKMTETFIDIEDVAAVVAEALTNEGHERRIYELTGPRALTFAEATSLIAAASDRPITYREITPEQYADALGAGGEATPRCSVEKPTATTRAPNRCSQPRTTAENCAVSLS
ncbi:NAD(P)H-binding protein [Streptomyces anthocyanicus]